MHPFVAASSETPMTRNLEIHVTQYLFCNFAILLSLHFSFLKEFCLYCFKNKWKPVAKFIVPDWGAIVDSDFGAVVTASQTTQSGGPVRQPYAGVNYIFPSQRL
jgi:hypothetical protein